MRKLLGENVSFITIKELEELAKKLNISLLNIESLVRQYGDDIVKDKLIQLNQRIQNLTLTRIEDNHAYLRSILANLNSTKHQDTSEKMPNESSTVEITQKQHAPQQVSKLGLHISKMREEINALPEADRQTWIRLGANSLIKRGLFSKADKKHSEMNTVVTGQLGTVVVQLYASETYGDDWPSQT